MKDKAVNPAMIVSAVVALAVLIFVIYRYTMGTSGPTPKAADAPAYTRPGYSGGSPYGPGSKGGQGAPPAGAPAPPGPPR